ncbi:MAG: hypothetical protein RR337_09285 [Clostridia bacterium]
MANLSACFKFPQAVRRLIYTTNAIAGFNRQLRGEQGKIGIFDRRQPVQNAVPCDDGHSEKIDRAATGHLRVIHAQMAPFFADRMPE